MNREAEQLSEEQVNLKIEEIIKQIEVSEQIEDIEELDAFSTN